jgi:radical SAM superfamily enzyme YgiQ (UPF0313 family)
VKVLDVLGEGINQYRPIDGHPNALQHGLSDEEAVSRIPKDAELICVSCMFSLEWPYNRSLVNAIREAFPHTPIVVGGEHVTAVYDYVLDDCPAVTYCSLGEGEKTISELADALSDGRSLTTVTGLAFKDQTGALVFTGPRKRIVEVGKLPRPAWNLVPIHAYLNNSVMTGVNLGRSMPILASRGCPYQCTFCSNPVMWGPLWKPRPPLDVIEEIEDYLREYNATNFDFYDLTAIVRKDWIVEFTNLVIERKLPITWQLPSGTRSEAIDHEVTALLYQSGCRYINYAPESGSERVLKAIKKKVNKDRMVLSMRSAIKNGMKVKANFILGFPEETYKDVVHTYLFLIQLALVGVHDVSVFPFTPYPGSELFAELKASGHIELNEEYFEELSQYTDMWIPPVSYSPHISGRALGFLTTFAMAMFFAISFAVRPMRFLQLIANVARRQPKTKLETSLDRIIEKRRIATSVGPTPQMPEKRVKARVG